MTDHDVRELFAEAAHWFTALVDRVPSDSWSRPGLGVWDVRALTGHTSRALITVDTYLDRPASRALVETPEDYYLQVLTPVTQTSDSAATDGAAVTERGRQAGLALGADPADFVRALVERVLTRLPADDPVIETIAGGMRLSDYLPTRTFELVVHGYDLAVATEVAPPPLSAEVISHALGLAGRIAVRRGQGPQVLSALTGRGPLTAGFTVI